MKEIFFGLGFSTKELDVIEEEHIDTPVAVSEFFGLFLFESSHKLVGILFCPDVENFQREKDRRIETSLCPMA